MLTPTSRPVLSARLLRMQQIETASLPPSNPSSWKIWCFLGLLHPLIIYFYHNQHKHAVIFIGSAARCELVIKRHFNDQNHSLMFVIDYLIKLSTPKQRQHWTSRAVQNNNFIKINLYWDGFDTQLKEKFKCPKHFLLCTDIFQIEY